MSQTIPDPLVAMSQALTPKRAVSYIRVSTREQAERAGTEEGFSIPAQREANKRKAASMGALVVKEFVDRGESARSANRPELQKMLTYLRQTPGIDYVIVHKLDRLARNRADDVEINKVFDDTGVRLVSTSENIDQTPGGILLHGIMSSIAEFYSRNLSNEVLKGMGEKARNGGTIGKAPLGYLNVRGRDAQGREIRTVELDPERAPLMRQAFTEYATGTWTIRQLAAHLAALGLTIPATPRKPATAITAGHLQTLLRHPYYKGVVTFQGVQYPGKHEPLADIETWEKVQQILDSHRNGERQRIHNHHLKTTVVCGLCGSRLLVQNTKNPHGTIYPYFVCARRHRLHDCNFKAVLIEEVDTRVADLYHRIHFQPEDRQLIEQYLHAELDQIHAHRARDIRSLTTRRTNLEDERRKLLHAHLGGAVPLDLLKEEQDRLGRELNDIKRTLAGYKADINDIRDHLAQALDLLEDCHRLYTAAPPHLRKQLNQVFFNRILINPDTDPDGRLITPPDPTAEPDHDPTDASATPGTTGEQEGLENQDKAPALPLLVRGPGGQPDAAARLNFPFNQLTSLNLRRAAQQHQHQHTQTNNHSEDEPDDSDAHPEGEHHSQHRDIHHTAGRGHHGNDTDNHDLGHKALPQRKAPTPQSEHASSYETAPTPTSHRASSYKVVMVREKGLEPSRPKAPEPKSGASTSSATRARSRIRPNVPGTVRWQSERSVYGRAQPSSGRAPDETRRRRRCRARRRPRRRHRAPHAPAIGGAGPAAGVRYGAEVSAGPRVSTWRKTNPSVPPINYPPSPRPSSTPWPRPAPP
ncbi:site-specific recombinases active site [Actinomyces glycerinitolerans]|uniref:Site-specific recombinases active site n=1 Tax=Actinomyces glycerinitolerans TaxID=1892869 RepID=A0A1M4S010_9ACTO|nr:site-specific recombinases active site [Actinomyces glycerinitolerans]